MQKIASRPAGPKLRHLIDFIPLLVRCAVLLAAFVGIVGHRAARADDTASSCKDIPRLVDIAVAEVSAKTKDAETALIKLYDCVKKINVDQESVPLPLLKQGSSLQCYAQR